MDMNRHNFTVQSVKQSKRRGEASLYTDLVETVDTWVVRLTSNANPGRAITLELESAVEAQMFSDGHVYSYEDIGNLFLS